MAYGKALLALSHPARRSLYERLRRGEQAVGELARAVRRSQPLVSQHLKVLERARLVTARRQGTRHLYRVRPEGLAELRAWVESLWDDVLAAYAGQPRELEEES
jgi:DNA-binding transcriptional ArsR family regulator